jgi:hypothetical protein
MQVYTHANNHAGYYPGAQTIDFKLLFDPKVGVRLLNLQGLDIYIVTAERQNPCRPAPAPAPGLGAGAGALQARV